MEDIQRNTSNDDHNTLKANKQPLMANEISRPTLSKLNDSVHRPPEDADRRECQSRQEALELPTLAQRRKDGVLVECGLAHCVESSTSLDGEVDAEGHEDGQSEDLESQACDHDVITGIRALVLVRGSRGDTAASSL